MTVNTNTPTCTNHPNLHTAVLKILMTLQCLSVLFTKSVLNKEGPVSASGAVWKTGDHVFNDCAWWRITYGIYVYFHCFLYNIISCVLPTCLNWLLAICVCSRDSNHYTSASRESHKTVWISVTNSQLTLTDFCAKLSCRGSLTSVNQCRLYCRYKSELSKLIFTNKMSGEHVHTHLFKDQACSSNST